MKKFLAFILSLTMLFGMLGGACTVFAASQTDEQSLGAVEPCAGHMLGSFNGLPACVDENGDLHICENNFPDANFRRNIFYLPEADDGYFTEKESQDVGTLSVSVENISSLKGVEFFKNLTDLSCSGNKLTQLDISCNPNLEFLSLSGNQLTELDVSSNPALTDLNCSNNSLTSLDLHGNAALSTLRCEINQLTELDLSGNHLLKVLSCQDNNILKLTICDNTAMVSLNCSRIGLTELILKNNTALEALDCSNNQLTQLDVGSNPALKYLDCSGNYIPELDLSNNKDFQSGNLSDQTVSMKLVVRDNFWIADLSQLVSPDHLDRITSVDGGDFDPQTGIVRFRYQPEWFEYHYQTRETGSTLGVLVEVRETIPDSIELTALPAKTTYRQWVDSFDSTGGQITLYYSDGTTGVMNLTDDMVVGFDNTKVGKQTLTAACSGCTVTFEIEIVAYNAYGDLNNDGKYTATDSMYIRLIVAELDQPAHNINYEAADVTGDGKYTAADTMYVRRLVAELITLEELPVNQ